MGKGTKDVKAWSPSHDLEGRAAFVETIQAQNEPFEDIRQCFDTAAFAQ